MTKRDWPAWLRPVDVFDLLKFATPIAVSRASMMLMALTDTIVLSRNAPEELSFVLNAWFPMSIAMGISMGLLLGVSILTAEMSGRGDAKDTGRIFRRGLLISFAFGIPATLVIVFGSEPLFRAFGFDGGLLAGATSATRILAYGLVAHMLSNAAAAYLEALRKPTFVTVSMYAGVVINLFVDLAFVASSWGFPALGADGVAIATTGTRWVIAVILIVFIYFQTPGFKASAAGPAGEFMKQLKLGYGMAVSSVTEWGAFNFSFIIATKASLVAGTVYGMVVHTIGFVFMAFLGIGTATSVRVAENVGAQRVAESGNAARLGVVTTIIVGAIAGGLMFVFSDRIAFIFVKQDEMLQDVLLYPLLTELIAIAAIVVIFDGLQNVASMASRSLGSVWPPSLIHLGSYAFLMLPLAWILALNFDRGVYGVLEGVIIASLIAGVLQVVFLEYYFAKQRRRAPGD